ncbi:MAG: isochorismatase family protein, partial [Candidatus Njordarchaeales archaeon]
MKKYGFSKTDEKIIEITGYGAKRGFGHSPALIIIDAQKMYVGVDKPILESIKIYHLSIGKRAWRAIERIKNLLDIARIKKVPVFYTVDFVPIEELQFSNFARKRIRFEEKRELPKDRNRIVDMIKPQNNEIIIYKRYSSALFGSPLISFLNSLNCDTLIVVGFVTSGCVRAFVFDASSYNFNVVVVEDCVADRFTLSHEVNLFDMNCKYADVVDSEEV